MWKEERSILGKYTEKLRQKGTVCGNREPAGKEDGARTTVCSGRSGMPLKLGHSLELAFPSKSAKRSENINRCIAQSSIIYPHCWLDITLQQLAYQSYIVAASCDQLCAELHVLEVGSDCHLLMKT